MGTYDHWKTTDPADEFLGPEPHEPTVEEQEADAIEAGIFKGPGIYTDIAAKDYFADPCPQPSLSQSIGKIIIAQSPRHAWVKHPRLNPNWLPDEYKYDKPRAIGNASHALVLGRGKDIEIVRVPRRVKEGRKWVVPNLLDLEDADDMTTDAAKEERDRIVDAGGSPILRKHMDVAEAIRDAARAQLDLAGCKEAFRDGHAEVALIAYDEEYGIWLRSMADWVCHGGLLYDLKTGEQSAAPHAIPRRMENDGWAVQAAMQERILDILDPGNRGRRDFRFVAIENEEPYGLTVTSARYWMEHGHRKLRYALEQWSVCLRSGRWPAYPPKVFEPEPPPYTEEAWLRREVSEAAHGRLPTVFDPNVVMAG